LGTSLAIPSFNCYEAAAMFPKSYSAFPRRLYLLLWIAASTGPAPAQRVDWQTAAGSDGGSGLNDGLPSYARFSQPNGIALDPAGSIYTADTNNHTIRVTSPDGNTLTYAGKPGEAGSGDGPAGDSRFNNPRGIARMADGSLVVADSGNHTIRRIDPLGGVTTLAGAAGLTGSIDGPGPNARFNRPLSVAVGADGAIYVADVFNQCIRRIGAGGVVSTFAGLAGSPGSADGPAATARFRSPRSVTIAPDGAVIVADSGNHTIRRISPDGLVATLAGSAGRAGFDDGTGSTARFRLPAGVTAAPDGNLYIADTASQLIRRIAPDGRVSTLAGSAGQSGWEDGSPGAAKFANPGALASAADGRLIIADTGNHALRTIAPDGTVGTLTGHPGGSGTRNGQGRAARFDLPSGIARSPDGSFAIAEEGSHTIRKLSASAEVSLLSGTPGTSGFLNGSHAEALYNKPGGVAYGPDGSLYIGDTDNKLIRLLHPTGQVSTLAGTYNPLLGEAGIPAYRDRLIDARGICLDPSGRVFLADFNQIREITAPETLQYVAGGVRLVTFLPPDRFLLFYPIESNQYPTPILSAKSPVCASDGTIFFADAGRHTILRCDPMTGEVFLLAGKRNETGNIDGTGPGARFNGPAGLAISPDGTLWVADTGNHLIRRVSRHGVVTTVGGLAGYTGTGDGIGSQAQFSGPASLTLDGAGALMVADRNNHRIVRGTLLGGPHLVAESALVHLPQGMTSKLPGTTPPGTPSAPVNLTIHNTGNAPLNLADIVLEGDDSAIFELMAPVPGSVLAPDSSMGLSLRFTPPSLGYFHTTLVLRSNDAENPVSRLRLTGTGNHLPTAPDYQLTVSSTSYTPLPVEKILAGATDPDGHALRITATDSTTSFFGDSTVRLDKGIIYIQPSGITGTNGFFMVTITDTLGGSVRVAVRVTSVSNDGIQPPASNNPPLLVPLEDGRMALTFHGIPQRSYHIQRSGTLGVWTEMAYLPAGADGRIQWIDPAPLPEAGFYRLGPP
jgi:sugar lactone lactonase YvrE